MPKAKLEKCECCNREATVRLAMARSRRGYNGEQAGSIKLLFYCTSHAPSVVTSPDGFQRFT